jgi:NAD(P)H-hydrate epimerase
MNLERRMNMEDFDLSSLKLLYKPPVDSHKGQNGKLMVIGGSHLFHAASLWALTIASRVVDMVFYSSVEENNKAVNDLKREFRNGIVVERNDIEDYIKEADCILIGPGMMRSESRIKNPASPAGRHESRIMELDLINAFKDEGEQSYYLTRYLLGKYPHKKWVIDAGALQMMEPEWLRRLEGQVVLTPHVGEFERVESRITNHELLEKMKKSQLSKRVELFAAEYKCIVLLKGKEDVVCSFGKCVRIAGGNAGMSKGGTGDVLAGLLGALACKNDLLLAAQAASYINKRAGESLFSKVGYFFNSSDLADEIPRVMAKLSLV